MKDFIKRIIFEQEEKYDTYEMLRNYQGPDITLQEIGRKLRVFGKITKAEYNKAISQFKKEYYATSILDSIRTNQKIHDLIKDLGTKTYNDLIRSEKKIMLKNNKKVKVGQPERNWILQNVRDLIFFKNHIEDTGKKFDFPDREYKSTITEECNKLIRQLGARDFFGFVEKDDWSILNRINTNYTNWIKLIAKSDVEGQLEGRTVTDKVKSYFTEKPIESVVDLSEYGPRERDLIKLKVPKMSLADVDIISLLISADDSESDYDYVRMLERIKKTTEKGESAERQFMSDLISNGVPKENIKNFSSYGNLVDITFQCDLMVKFKDTWVPIQIKSSQSKYSKLLSYDIGGILVYPAEKKRDCGNWVYDTGRGLPKSFDEDFLGLVCDNM
jgi:hypothetical protein